MRKAMTKQKGFTLIEAIITLVVLSIAAVGVLSVFSTGMKGSADPLLLSQGLLLAQEKMEETKAWQRSAGFAAVVAGSGVFPPPFDAFSWARVVNCVDATLNPAPCAGAEHKRVTVTVAWNSGAESLNLVTLITNY